MPWVTVDVDLNEFSTEELKTELKERGFTVYDDQYGNDVEQIVTALYQAQRLGKPIDEHIRTLFWEVIGRIE